MKWKCYSISSSVKIASLIGVPNHFLLHRFHEMAYGGPIHEARHVSWTVATQPEAWAWKHGPVEQHMLVNGTMALNSVAENKSMQTATSMIMSRKKTKQHGRARQFDINDGD